MSHGVDGPEEHVGVESCLDVVDVDVVEVGVLDEVCKQCGVLVHGGCGVVVPRVGVVGGVFVEFVGGHGEDFVGVADDDDGGCACAGGGEVAEVPADLGVDCGAVFFVCGEVEVAFCFDEECVGCGGVGDFDVAVGVVSVVVGDGGVGVDFCESGGQ